MMPILRAWSLGMRSMFRKEQLDRELDAEFASHLELHIADNLRAGMTPEAAQRDALLKLGGMEQTKESVRDRRGIPGNSASGSTLRVSHSAQRSRFYSYSCSDSCARHRCQHRGLQRSQRDPAAPVAISGFRAARLVYSQSRQGRTSCGHVQRRVV